MNTFLMILQILIILIAPIFLIKLRNSKFISFLGTTGTAYLIGILLALIIYLLNKFELNLSFNSDVSEIGSHVAIGLAIPLLLFSTNLKSIKNLSKKSLTAFSLLTISVVVVSVILGIIFNSKLPLSDKLAGMAIGLYTGGTPNLNAIGEILGVESNIIALSNLSDMIIGGIFYIFLLLLCKPLLKRFLGENKTNYYRTNTGNIKNSDILETKSLSIKNIALSIISSFIILIIGALIGLLIFIFSGQKDGTLTSILVPSIMLTSTVLGLCGSAIKKLRETKGNNLIGHYLILVFSIALAMAIDLRKINSTSTYIFVFFSTITACTFILHVILCKIFKIDVDCSMVTLTAGIYGPAFIPAITKQIDNEELTPVGLICGSLGYAIGTFLGVGIAGLLLLI